MPSGTILFEKGQKRSNTMKRTDVVLATGTLAMVLFAGIEEFLAFERVRLTGEWTFEKTVSSLAVPLILGLLCLAFWRRSLLWGLVIINAIAVTKLVWGVVDGGDTG
jgi:hypothetical protein